MGLFANEREANLESTVAMVEDVLIELGHFVNDCREEREGATFAWSFVKGSATIAIDLFDSSDFWRVRVSATIMTLDEKVDTLGLYARLLTANAQEVTGAAFALQGDAVLLVSERSTLDLDRSELHALVNVVRNIADDYDDKLVAEFGGALGGGPQAAS